MSAASSAVAVGLVTPVVGNVAPASSAVMNIDEEGPDDAEAADDVEWWIASEGGVGTVLMEEDAAGSEDPAKTVVEVESGREVEVESPGGVRLRSRRGGEAMPLIRDPWAVSASAAGVEVDAASLKLCASTVLVCDEGCAKGAILEPAKPNEMDGCGVDGINVECDYSSSDAVRGIDEQRRRLW